MSSRARSIVAVLFAVALTVASCSSAPDATGHSPVPLGHNEFHVT